MRYPPVCSDARWSAFAPTDITEAGSNNCNRHFVIVRLQTPELGAVDLKEARSARYRILVHGVYLHCHPDFMWQGWLSSPY